MHTSKRLTFSRGLEFCLDRGRVKKIGVKQHVFITLGAKTFTVGDFHRSPWESAKLHHLWGNRVESPTHRYRGIDEIMVVVSNIFYVHPYLGK